MHGTRLVKISKFCFKWPGWCYLAPLDATNFANGYPTIKETVCSKSGENRFSDRCATCISHTISHKATQLRIHQRDARHSSRKGFFSKLTGPSSPPGPNGGPWSGLFPEQTTNSARRCGFVWQCVRNACCTAYSDCLRQIRRYPQMVFIIQQFHCQICLRNFRGCNLGFS
jgi:hypothetical protein